MGKKSGLSEVRGDVRMMRVVLGIVPWRMRWRILALLVASAAVSLLDMVAVATMLPLTQMLTSGGTVPDSVRRYVVPIVGSDDRDVLLIWIALFVGASFLVKNVALIGIRWWSLGVTTRASGRAEAEMLALYVASDYGSFRRRSRATMIQTVTSAIPSSFGAVLLGYIAVAIDAMSIVLLLGALVTLAPMASLVAVVCFGGAALIISRLLRPASLRFGLRGLELGTESWNQLNPAIEGFREARIFRREAMFANRFRTNREKAAQMERSQAILGEMPKYILEVVLIAGIIIVAVILFATRPESVAFGLLAVFAAAAIRLVPALNRVVTTLNGIRGGRPSLQLASAQIEELQGESKRMSLEELQTMHAPPPDADIEVRGLGYRYPDGDRDVLTDVDVTIPRGQTIALVGSSGAGKSTFADLLSGLLTPTAGSITVGDMDVATEGRRWQQEVAVVSQRVYLWDATIRDLITFGEPPERVDADHLDDVIRRARLTELVADLPDGLDSRVGDGGVRLSGGQAQRLGIARALYPRPQVLILDEATSALDNQTEHEITQTIEALHGDITVVVIAHRLSTVKNADEILFFSSGRLADRGTMAQLREKNAEFAQLVELGSLA